MSLEFVLSDVETFSDGRVEAPVYSADGSTYVTSAQADDGAWLIDVDDLAAGTIAPLRDGTDATPGA